MTETKPPIMKISPVTAENLAVYHQLAQGYEAEDSAITGKMSAARIGDDVRGG